MAPITPLESIGAGLVPTESRSDDSRLLSEMLEEIGIPARGGDELRHYPDEIGTTFKVVPFSLL